MIMYIKNLFVMDYLEKLNVDTPTILIATSDQKLKKSFRLIKKNPKISKEEFLKIMNIEEYTWNWSAKCSKRKWRDAWDNILYKE